MSLSSPFIARPIATSLLTIGLFLAGGIAFFLLPVSPMPNVDYPTISVSGQLPGASPDTVATSVATPLERYLGTIAGVNEMTSQSSVGSVRITLQFDLDRDIDGAARDVQAAINAARVDLPTSLRSNPTYRKVNPADAPIVILTLTSDMLTPGQMYDSASTVLQQKLLQVKGIGDVTIGGSSLPAVRVELNPNALSRYGIGLEDIRAALAAANANSPKGAIEEEANHYQIYVNDTATTAAEYKSLIVAYRNNASVRLSDVADVSDSVENVRNLGLANGKPAISLIIYRQPGANIINVVDRIRAIVPELQASIPENIKITVANDRTTTIRASLRDIEHTLLVAIALVVLVTFLFLRDARSALIPSVTVPLSLIGTFGAMYLLGFSIDNLSLMALTVATGFVVDDAIVVLENTMRHIEAGESQLEAALNGAREVGFTVLSMSLSLIAVFLPILLMGGLVGRIFREFAMTLSIAILISLVVSLTTAPTMCAYLLRRESETKHGWFMRTLERGFNATAGGYDRTLTWVLGNRALIAVVLAVTVALNVYLFIIIPKGFFPQQDTGALVGGLRADQSISFQALEKKFTQFVSIVQSDPAVENVVGFTGGGGGGGGGAVNSGFVFIQLKPLAERKVRADAIIGRLRSKLGSVAGARLFLQAVQDIRAGGRQSNAQYQYTIQSDNLEQLSAWMPKITKALQNLPQLEDVNSDQQDAGLEASLIVDRATATRLGLDMSEIDNTLYDAFGQRQVSTIYSDFNQYHVVMEVAPQYWQNPEMLRDIYVSVGGEVSGTQSTAFTTVTPTTVTSNGGASGSGSSGPGQVATTPPLISPSLSAATAAQTVSAPTFAAPASAATSATSGNFLGSTAAPSAAPLLSSSSTSTTASTSVSAPSFLPASATASAGAPSTSMSTTASAAATATIRNQALNQLTNSTHATASSGASVSTTAETMVPLSAFSHYQFATMPLAINHQGPFVATTISFNLPDNQSLGTATAAINKALRDLHAPSSLHGTFAGTAQVFQSSLSNEPLLIAAALVAVYIVLGVLYESYVHPLTILSTLPSAGVGAVLALLLFHMDFSLIALIGVILLIGIVKKNAIMMIDVALVLEREEGREPEKAIHEACLRRFRPILMTTIAAMLGAVPLAIISGEGAEMRKPLGISIVGGLLVSQILTLYTTPVVYLFLDEIRLHGRERIHRWLGGFSGRPRRAAT